MLIEISRQRRIGFNDHAPTLQLNPDIQTPNKSDSDDKCDPGLPTDELKTFNYGEQKYGCKYREPT